MAWTNVAKPSVMSWDNTNPQGRQQYDQSDIEYDQADVFYDGINPAMWTDVSKPGVGSWTNVAKPI